MSKQQEKETLTLEQKLDTYVARIKELEQFAINAKNALAERAFEREVTKANLLLNLANSYQEPSEERAEILLHVKNSLILKASEDA